MSETQLNDDRRTEDRLDSVARVLEWMMSMPVATRRRFSGALAESCDELRQKVESTLNVMRSPGKSEEGRRQALRGVAAALHLDSNEPNEEQGRGLANPDSQQAAFVNRLRELMDTKRISQRELAERIGCSQPAISQILSRHRRPRKQTILKLAEAFEVDATDLWPDIEVAERLDTVVEFQREDYIMTEAEARALGDRSNQNRPKVPAKSLPKRGR